MNREILCGDVLEQLATLPEKSIDCVISSPMYWGLRNYGVEGQWGLEPNFRDYLEKMNKFMEAIRRVLKDTGSVWINLGDTYSTTTGAGYFDRGNQSFDKEEKYGQVKDGKDKGFKPNLGNLQQKSRVGIPERFYINCIDNGWIARNHITWYKANSMPSSVKDRFTNKWESIFFFTKQQKYYFNLDAIREKTITVNKQITKLKKNTKERFSQKALDKEVENHNEKGERKMADVPGQLEHGIHRRREKGLSDWEGYGNKLDRKWSKVDGQVPQTIADKHYGNYDKDGNNLNHQKGKNPGDVFFINPHPFSEAHFATFPIELPIKILKCACPPNGIVLDPFFGAGTVGVAAEKLGLRWIGIELKEEYIKLARKRLDPYKNERLFIAY